MINVAAASLGVTLGATSTQDPLGIKQVNAAVVRADLVQEDGRAADSVGSVPPPVVGL